ncbi:hypothetical protein V6N13_145380 [Hibiscus sabdariffa]
MQERQSCHFLHQDIQNRKDDRQNRAGASKYITHDDGKDYLINSGRSTDCCTDYLKGSCRRGASCRFAHDGASDVFSRRPTSEISSEREHAKRNRVRTPERDGGREARRTSDIPCKFFAAGNCHNGKYCRFSHHGQARVSHERRSRGDRGVWGPSSVSVDKLQGAETPWTGPKWSDLDVSNDVNNSWTGPKWSDLDASNEVNNSWTGSKWSDADASNDVENSWTGSKWRNNGKNIEGNAQHKTVNIGRDDGLPRKIENAGNNMGVSEPKVSEELLGDMEMSPEWNYRIQSSVKKEHSHSSKSTPVETLLPAQVKDITKEASGQMHDGLAALQPTLAEKSSIQQDHMTGSSAVALPSVSSALSTNSNSHIDLKFSTNVLPLPSFDQPGPSPTSVPYSSLNTVGQSQVTIPSNEINIKGTQHNQLFQVEKASKHLNAGDANILHGNSGYQSTQTMGSNEQLTQLANFSASLAQFFGKGHQFPLLRVALNSHDGMQVNSCANSGAHVEPDSGPTVQPDQGITLPKQYDPSISDSIEPAGKLLASSLLVSNTGDDNHNDHSSKREPDFDSHKRNQLEPDACSEGKKENGGVEETKKAEGGNGQSENVDADDRTDEGKKNKDGKGIRTFKFALVEFVKDLLKPTWKEGQIGKEAYKNIVKKVVDKVITTVQGTNIPQTPEKVDQYLSISKPKLNKLVQVNAASF